MQSRTFSRTATYPSVLGSRDSQPVLYSPPQDIASRFGAKLRFLRKERAMTQMQMAVDFGIDRSYISDVERGLKAISLPLVEVIAIGMNMTLTELMQDL